MKIKINNKSKPYSLHFAFKFTIKIKIKKIKKSKLYSLHLDFKFILHECSIWAPAQRHSTTVGITPPQ